MSGAGWVHHCSTLSELWYLNIIVSSLFHFTPQLVKISIKIQWYCFSFILFPQITSIKVWYCILTIQKHTRPGSIVRIPIHDVLLEQKCLSTFLSLSTWRTDTTKINQNIKMFEARVQNWSLATVCMHIGCAERNSVYIHQKITKNYRIIFLGNLVQNKSLLKLLINLLHKFSCSSYVGSIGHLPNLISLEAPGCRRVSV